MKQIKDKNNKNKPLIEMANILNKILAYMKRDFRLIPLTQIKFAKVDLDDFERVDKFNWYADYCKNTKGFYAKGYDNKKRIKMHRLIMNTPNDLVVDHINHDTLDNRKKNLRNVTKGENNGNNTILFPKKNRKNRKFLGGAGI